MAGIGGGKPGGWGNDKEPRTAFQSRMEIKKERLETKELVMAKSKLEKDLMKLLNSWKGCQLNYDTVDEILSLVDNKSQKLRPFGDLTQDLEDLLGEAAEEHDLQMGEILAWVKNYLDIHYPDCVELYEDGTRPEYYYGPRRD